MGNARDIPSMEIGESQEQERGYSGSTKRQKENPLCYTVGHLSPEKRGGRTQITQIQRQSRARGDILKDDSGPCAVFTEQGSSASQMTAQKQWMLLQVHQIVTDKQLMQYLPTLKWNWRTLPDCSNFLSQNVQKYGNVFHDTNGRKPGRTPMSRIVVRKDTSRKFYWNLDGKKVPIWECLLVHRKQGLFLSVFVNDMKMTGKKQKMVPMWKKMMKKCGS